MSFAIKQAPANEVRVINVAIQVVARRPARLRDMRLLFVLATLVVPLLVRADPAPIPIAPDTTFVIAVSDQTGHATPADAADHHAQGDYETVVTIGAVDAGGVSQAAFIDGVDSSGVRQQVTIARRVLAADLASSHLQILGFDTEDPEVFDGTTTLGPSRAITHELLTTGSTRYSFRNFGTRETISGTLTRDAGASVSYPVLINGQRVQLNAIRTTGQMTAGGQSRPFEHIILDHPLHPVSLRIAFGPRGGGFPFKAEFAREVVRIDFPVTHAASLAEALEKRCRAEVSGIYFDFNEAALKPQSKRALQEIAAVLRKQPQRPTRIEGHTDDIGGERYNDDLSARRAAAVKTALVQDYHVDGSSLTTQGFGERRPIETNSTLAGRARNRRVELARDCPHDR